MPEATVFEDLSRELPDDERERLRKRISAQLERGSGDEVLRIGLKGADRTRLLARELARVGWWVKLSIWLRSLFSVADKETLLIDQKLAGLRRKIRLTGANLIIFESRVLTDEFAKKLYALYRAVFPVIGLVRDFSRNPKFIQEAFVYLVQARLKEPRSRLEHFIEPEEMVEVLQEGEARDLRSEVARRVDAHFEELPAAFYNDLQRGLEPLLYLRGLVLLPFASIFSNFSYTLTGIPGRDMPHFTSSSVALLLESVEKLYHGVFMVLRLGKDWQLHPELTTYYAAANPTDAAEQPAATPTESAAAAPDLVDAGGEGGEGGEAGTDADADADADADGDSSEAAPDGPSPADQRPSERARVAQQFAGSIQALLKATQQFASEVPLLDIIRYFRRDPYYSLAFTVPRYYVRNIYTSAMRKKVLEELDGRIGEVERRVLNNRSEELFGKRPVDRTRREWGEGTAEAAICPAGEG